MWVQGKKLRLLGLAASTPSHLTSNHMYTGPTEAKGTRSVVRIADVGPGAGNQIEVF